MTVKQNQSALVPILQADVAGAQGRRREKRLLERYVQQLSAQEDRLQAIQTESAQLRGRRETLQAELARMVETLAFDAGASGAAACGS